MRRATLTAAVLCLLVGTALSARAQAPTTPGAGAGRPRFPQPLSGRLKAKADTGFDLQRMARGGAAGQTYKVTTDPETAFWRVPAGKQEDLTEGYLVAVYGERTEGKVAANAIVRLTKPEGTPKMEALRPLFMLARAVSAARWTRPRGQAGQQPATGQGEQPQGGAQLGSARRGRFRTLGKITKTNPLTIETMAFGNRPAQTLEVQLGETPRIRTAEKIKAADLREDATVAVVPKAAPEGNAVTATVVVETRAPGEQGRQGR